jgi:hypothetical protein
MVHFEMSIIEQYNNNQPDKGPTATAPANTVNPIAKPKKEFMA